MISPEDRLLAAFNAYLSAKSAEIPSRFLENSDAPMHQRALDPKPLPCLRHLDRAVGLSKADESALVTTLAANAHALHWGQTYTVADFDRHFIDNYGWLEVFGTRGHFAHESVAAGFLILGPNLVYPDHHHVAEEIYIPLTGGAKWRKGDGEFAERRAGEVIHHPSNINHAMRTGAEPLLALYLWHGGPLAQKSVVTGSAGA